MKINEYYYTFFYTKETFFLRTDFIYSKDFERLFIGKVIFGGELYSNTFLVNLCEIKEFEYKYGFTYIYICYKNENKKKMKFKWVVKVFYI